MAQFNENITLAAPNPLDKRYLSNRTSGGSQLPYSGLSEVWTTILPTVRYSGLTVLIKMGTTNIEYWFKDGIQNANLIEKKYDSVLPITDYITGGTNVGYFSGFTGIQTLPITNLPDVNFNGNYFSLYNYYYRGTDGIIHIGVPSDGIQRRGYVKPSGVIKSWIWSEYVGGSDLVGWALIDGSIANQIGTFQYSNIYYNGTSTFPYNNTGWTTGVFYTNGSQAVISSVVGSLTTGNTLTIGGRPFVSKVNNNLHFRTIISDTPATLKVRDDNDALIHLSGATINMSAKNLTAIGSPVYSGQTGTTFLFRTLVGAGSTTITDFGNRLVISSTGGTNSTYNLSTPAAITVGGIASGTQLTGKTSFQLFEELLVPTLNPTLVDPSVTIGTSPSGTFEIGCVITTLGITGTYNAGSISPQYTSASSCRSNGVSAYCFVGAPITNNYVDSNTTHVINVPSYSVLSGAQTWTLKACTMIGVQPKNSKGGNYMTPYPISETPTLSTTITGILPYYWGLSSSMAVSAACVAACGCGGYGAKVLQNVGASPFPITFNSTSNDYIWFALPACASTKTCWCVNATNNGVIGGTGNLFAAPYTCSITSVEGCWTGCNYEIYVSCYKSGTAAGVPMYIS